MTSERDRTDGVGAKERICERLAQLSERTELGEVAGGLASIKMLSLGSERLR